MAEKEDGGKGCQKEKMIVIYAEKPDMGTKIAAALDGISLGSRKVSFSEIEKYERQIKAQRAKDGCFMIRYDHQETCVIWGYGHMCELKQAKDINPAYAKWSNIPLPYIPEQYELKLVEGANQQYRKIREMFRKADKVICATDNDREGDLIMDYLCTYMGYHGKYWRAIYYEQSKESFQKAFSPENLVSYQKRKPVIDAGRARSAGDFLVGSGLTVAMTLKYPGNKVLSVGRVQTAVLEMIVERERAIRDFKPERFYSVKGKFVTDEKEVYEGSYQTKQIFEREKVRELLQKLRSTDHSTVAEVQKKKAKKNKPYLYNLQTLQMDCNKKFGLSLSDTLKIAQKLYEDGYTTYPRTDSMYLPNDMVPEMEEVLFRLVSTDAYKKYAPNQSVQAAMDISRHYFDSTKVESHYAIVPTKKTAKLQGTEQKVYDLIARSVLCMLYPDAVISKTMIRTACDGEIFLTNGTSIVEPGFYTVLGLPKETFLPSLTEGERVDGTFSADEKWTEPPKRYTDATLLSAMINCGKTLEDEDLRNLMAGKAGEQPKGLGRPSSQASIVKTLETRGYTEKQGKSIQPTEKGMLMMDCFPVEELKSAIMTAQWEKRLDDIEHGLDSYTAFMSDMEDAVRTWTREILDAPVREEFIRRTIMETDYKCPECGKPIDKYPWGYGCSGHKEKSCDFHIRSEIAGVEIPEKEWDAFFTNGKTGMIKGFKKKDGGTFSAMLKYDPDSKQVVFAFESESDLKCPTCGRSLLESTRTYTCPGTKDNSCAFVLWKRVYDKILPQSVVKKLLKDGISDPVSGLKGRDGSSFTAPLKLDEETGRVTIYHVEKECSYVCPICESPMKEYSWGYGCTDTDLCGFRVGKKICAHDLTEEELQDLFEKGETDVLKFYSANKQKDFYARLVVDREERKVKFEYDEW